MRISPRALADVLAGRRPCRFGRGGKPFVLDLALVHTLVLWTKDPRPMVSHEGLRIALQQFVHGGGQVYLQLTATGFAGTFVEWTVPGIAELRAGLARVLDAGLVAPGAVKMRYDPLLRVRAGEVVVSNMRQPVFEAVLDAFAPLGVEDVVTSYVDASRYPKVRRRFEEQLGVALDDVPEEEVRACVAWMAQACRERGMRFDTCAAPKMPFGREGCIAGSRFNALMRGRHGGDAPCCSEQMHNDVAPKGQRVDCRCTYSRDIGYSAGFKTCYTQGTGCVYCYSHHEALGGKLLPALRDEVAALRSDTEAFLRQPGKEPYRLLSTRGHPEPFVFAQDRLREGSRRESP